ncbi:MAG: hypothetical protein J2P41_21845, partial [Blastocatellia bacterium]|nr:hypothetical protein [Blastocatellia bacterium]
IDPDQEFRSILITELRAALNFRVEGASPQECAGRRSILLGSIPVALYAQAEEVTAALPDKMSCLLLHTRSVPKILKDEKMPAKDDLIIIASRWPAFLQYAHSMLGALKIDPDSLSFRDAREADWQKGLRAGTFVIADAATAEQIPPGVRVRVFSIIADSSLAEMRQYVEKFLKN